MLVYDHVRINFILGFKNYSKRGFRASLFFTCKRVKKMIIKFFWKLKIKKNHLSAFVNDYTDLLLSNYLNFIKLSTASSLYFIKLKLNLCLLISFATYELSLS